MDSIDINVKAITDKAIDLMLTKGLQVIWALVILAAGWWIARMVRAWVRRALERTTIERTLVPFVCSLIYYLTLTFVIVAVLGLFGIQTTSIITVIGAAGLAVGLALQGTLSNFAAGVMLLVFRPFKIGDYVEAAGTSGNVMEIGIFSTRLNTPDNIGVTLPNSSIYGQVIRNFSANDTRRVDMVIGISYSDDIGKAIETIRETLLKDERVLREPGPTVGVSDLADSSVNLVVRPWCRREDYWAVRFDLTRALKENLEAAGCSIPFPQRDVHLFQSTGAAS